MSHWLTGSCHSVCAHPANLSFLLNFSKKHQRLGIWLLPATSCAFTTKLTRLAPKSAVFCLLRLSGTLFMQSLAPLWSLIVSLLEAVFTSHFATKDKWTCEKTGDHFPQLTRCVKWNDWSILVTMWIFTQGKPKIAWGETLLSDFFYFPEWFIHPSKRTFTEQQVISLDVPCWLSNQVKMPRRWNDRFARYVHTKWQDPWLMTKKMRSR